MTEILPQNEPRFVADATVVRLAKWMRILGYDTICCGGLGEKELLSRALSEGRTVLSRKRKWLSAMDARKIVVLRGDRVRDQLHELIGRSVVLPDPQRFLTLCVRCNEPLEEAAKDLVADAVPAYVRDRGTRFHRCPRCGRIYWPGSHPERIRQFLKRSSPGRLP